MKPLVYIASPYTRGVVNRNLQAHFAIFEKLRDSGLVTPIAPLSSHLIDLVLPSSWQIWLNYDFEVIAHCNALLAQDVIIPGYEQHESTGRDCEIEYASELGIRVFFNTPTLYEWAKETK